MVEFVKSRPLIPSQPFPGTTTHVRHGKPECVKKLRRPVKLATVAKPEEVTAPITGGSGEGSREVMRGFFRVYTDDRTKKHFGS